MAFRPLPEQALLLQLFRYDPDSGILYRRKKSGVETPAGTLREDGYIQMWVCGRLYLAHRIILKMVYGVAPEFADHENGVRNDNRLKNISSVTKKQNHKNMRRPQNNSSGVIGVTFDKRRSVWYAYIKTDQVMKNLGCYKRFADAVAARKRAESERGFHSNHGREPLVVYKSSGEFKRKRDARAVPPA